MVVCSCDWWTNTVYLLHCFSSLFRLFGRSNDEKFFASIIASHRRDAVCLHALLYEYLYFYGWNWQTLGHDIDSNGYLLVVYWWAYTIEGTVSSESPTKTSIFYICTFFLYCVVQSRTRNEWSHKIMCAQTLQKPLILYTLLSNTQPHTSTHKCTSNNVSISF